MKWSRTIRFNHPVRDVCRSPARGCGREADPAAARRREEQAYERGVVDGERRLGEQLLQQRNELQRLHAGVLSSLREAVAGVIRDSENALVDVAFEVARKVIDGVPISRELVEAGIRSALAEAEDATEFCVQLHPDDLALLRQHSSQLLDDTSAPHPVRFVAGPDIARGGCLVRTEFGVIDARRETRLNRLRQALEA